MIRLTRHATERLAERCPEIDPQQFVALIRELTGDESVPIGIMRRVALANGAVAMLSGDVVVTILPAG